MDMDDDDDFYAPEEPETTAAEPAPAAAAAGAAHAKAETRKDDLEEGEEEDEGGEMDEDDDSDVDIVIEPKDQPPSVASYSEIRNIPQRTTANDATPPLVSVSGKKGAGGVTRAPSAPVAQPVSTSKIDVNAVPVHKATGKPITQVNFDQDLENHDKPWRKPGTDINDYFNYGFDEFTWTLYAAKQEALRNEYNQDIMDQSNKKMLEDMASMMMMGGMMPGMGGAAGASGAPAGGMPSMPGMDAMTPEMQAMMQQMMAGGMDPSQMDPSAMSAMFSGMQTGAGGGANAGQGVQGQNFGNAFGGNQGQGFGYDQQQVGGGGGNRGNFGGNRGNRRGRNWQ